MSPPGRFFHGWYIVAGVFVVTTTTSGLAFYNLSILLAAFVAERGFPVALASSATATFFVASGIGGVISGRLIERIDARYVIAASAAVGALALESLSVLRETWQLYAFHVVFGLSHGSSGLVPATTVVARWFNARRALAFSIAFTGLSFGGILIAPAVALMISRLGLSGAAPFMGLAYFLGVVPVALLVLRPSPAAMGLTPDGAPPVTPGESVAQPAVSYADAWRSRYFYAVSIAYLFLLGAQVGAIAHLYRLASVRDGVATAALAIATMATSSTIGRLAGGGVTLWVSVRSFALALMAMQAVALAQLAFAVERTTILAGACVFGLTIGNSLMMHPLLLAERFGTRDYGRIYSMSQLLTMIGVASCPALIGVMYEVSGDYEIPFLAVCGATLIGFLVLSIFADRSR